MNTFTATWTERRTPATITFPSGEVKTVEYMRDGLILFTDGDSANYKRLGDFSAEITLNESWEQVQATLDAYKKKAG